MKSPVAHFRPTLEEIVGNPIIPMHHEGTQKIVMAFDLSSTCCGWAVGRAGQLDRFGKVWFKSGSGLVTEKLSAFQELVYTLMTTYRPAIVLLEKPMSRRAKVTARHYELVGVLRAETFTCLGLDIPDEHMLAPATIKKWMEVPSGNDHDMNKIIMVNEVNRVHGLTLQFDKQNKARSDDDIADAIAVFTTWHRKAAEV